MSRHQLNTATRGSHAGNAFADRPYEISGRAGAISLARNVSKSLSGVNSWVKMITCTCTWLCVYMHP